MAIFISIAKTSRRSGSNSAFIGIPPETSQDANKNPQGHGQSHLELDESTLKSTGKSVSVDDVIANIDKALKDEI